MRKITYLFMAVSMTCFIMAGCGKKAPAAKGAGAVTKIERVDVAPGEPLYYLEVTAAEASSFDETPDWAPEPKAIAAADGNVLTRWSSNYENVAQWIYFDFGTEAVVSDVIIRWERAYAAKYAVLVSKDAKEWGEVYRDENSKGGVTEASFPAVRCRYVKVLGTEKVKEEWGVSIWEVEIFGPKSHNPLVKISKEEYLARCADEAKKKEAEEKIESLASPIPPLSEKPFQNGVVLTSWTADELESPASDLTLACLKETGFDTVSIMVPVYQEALNSESVYANDGPGGDTPSVASLRHAIRTCHKLGMRVLLKVHVDPRTNEARINITPSEKWFDSYKAMIIKYAALAEEENVELFSVGTELEGTTFETWDARWRDIIAAARNIYKGLLTYSANWTEYKEVAFWSDLDYIGIDAYFPLTQKDEPALEELVAAWEKNADDIENWLKEKGLVAKGVVFTEIGYTSTDGANRQPWAAISNKEDQDEQAASLDAAFIVMSKRPWFKGYQLWQYMPQERWSPLGFTVSGKKAEEIIKKWLGDFSQNR